MSCALNALRSQKRRDLRFVRDTAAGEKVADERVSSPGSDDGQSHRIRLALDSLRPDHRAVVVLRLLEERSTRQTAEILQIPDGTVLSRLSRAVQQLRVTLGPVWTEYTE